MKINSTLRIDIAAAIQGKLKSLSQQRSLIKKKMIFNLKKKVFGQNRFESIDFSHCTREKSLRQE